MIYTGWDLNSFLCGCIIGLIAGVVIALFSNALFEWLFDRPKGGDEK